MYARIILCVYDACTCIPVREDTTGPPTLPGPKNRPLFSFRTAIIYPGVTDWSLERGRDNTRAEEGETPWMYMRVRMRMRVIDPTVARAIRMASSCVSLWIDVDLARRGSRLRR